MKISTHTAAAPYKEDLKSLHCKQCDIPFNDRESMVDHLRGKSHLMRRRRLKDQEIRNKTGKSLNDNLVPNYDEDYWHQNKGEAVDQAKLVSSMRKGRTVPQPINIVMKKKDKKTSARQAVCDLICVIIYFGVILGLLGLFGFGIYSFARWGSIIGNNQQILANELTKHQNGIYNLQKDVQTLKDSVKHIKEERLHGDDDDDVTNYHDTSSPANPMSEGKEDSDDLHDDIEEDEEYTIMMSASTTGSPPPFESSSQATQSQREKNPDDYREYYYYHIEGPPALH